MTLSGQKIMILAPAKINAFLEVTGRRSDGYHEIRTLFVPVSIYDRIEMTMTSGAVTVRCTSKLVPEDENNLAARAARLFFQESGIRSGVDIDIEKNIPVAAGLGGGSSDAASVLKGLDNFFGNPFGYEALCRLALLIGADVPFFIKGVPSLAEGIGEVLYPAPLLVPYSILIVNPGIPLSTAEVYKNLNLGLTKRKKENKYPALNQGLCDIKTILCNDLENPAIRLCPVIEDVKRTVADFGAEGTLMSGSGPSVFGLFSDSGKADMAADLIRRNKKWWAFRADMNLCPL